ncbi:hypothetical protein GCM10025786_28750 [Nocardioides caeni]
MVELVGRFPVSVVIGRGGFGTVYLGTDPVTGERVAVKVLNDPDAQWRRSLFRAEAAALRSVADPHVVRVREVIDEPGLAALVTDFVEGASLRRVVAESGPLSGPETVAVLTGALKGLAAVHAAGLVHADLKPDNILVDLDGTSRLIDFGLAGPARPLGGPDTWIGTPAYLAPEVVRGSHVDHRSDIYAMAVILFELLGGRQPFVGGSALATALLQVSAPVPDVRSVRADVAELLAGLCSQDLAKDPVERHQRAEAFARSLDIAAGVSYGEDWAAETAASLAGRSRTTITTIAAAAAGVAAAGVGVPVGVGLLGAAPVVAPGALSFLLGGIGLGAAGAAGAGAAGAGAAVGGAGGAGVGGFGAAGAAAGAAGGGGAAATTSGGALAALGGAKAAAAAAAAVVAVTAGTTAVIVTNTDDAPRDRPPAAAPAEPAILAAYTTSGSGFESAHLLYNDGTSENLGIDATSGALIDFTASHDGQWLAVSLVRTSWEDPSMNTADITVISTLDPSVRDEITCNCAAPTFSFEGQLVTATSDLELLRFEAGPNGLEALASLTLDGGELGIPTYPPTIDAANDREGFFTAASTTAYDATRAMAVDLDTGLVRTIAEPGDSTLGGATLSEDGRFLAYGTNAGGTACSAQRGIVIDTATGDDDLRAAYLEAPADYGDIGEVSGVWFDGNELEVGWTRMDASQTSGCAREEPRRFRTTIEELPPFDPGTYPSRDWTPSGGPDRSGTTHDGRTWQAVDSTDGSVEQALVVEGQQISNRVLTFLFVPEITGDPQVQSSAASSDSESPRGGSIVDFNPPAEVDGSGDVSALDELPQDFRDFVAARARELYDDVAGDPDCGDRNLTFVTVDRYDPRGYASGEVTGCGGAMVVWARTSGAWQEVAGFQGLQSCDPLREAEVPADFFAEEFPCLEPGDTTPTPYVYP